MQTVREQNGKGISVSGYRPYQNPTQTPVSVEQVKRLTISEFKSWSACFVVIALLTGLLKILKLAVTMETVTSILFYGSLAMLAFLIFRIRSLSGNPVPFKGDNLHELN